MINVKKIFSGRMNQDDAQRVMPPQDFRFAQDVSIVYDEDGGLLSIKSSDGNNEFSNWVGGKPAFSSSVQGVAWTEDRARGWGVLAVRDPEGGAVGSSLEAEMNNLSTISTVEQDIGNFGLSRLLDGSHTLSIPNGFIRIGGGASVLRVTLRVYNGSTEVYSRLYSFSLSGPVAEVVFGDSVFSTSGEPDGVVRVTIASTVVYSAPLVFAGSMTLSNASSISNLDYLFLVDRTKNKIWKILESGNFSVADPFGFGEYPIPRLRGAALIGDYFHWIGLFGGRHELRRIDIIAGLLKNNDGFGADYPEYASSFVYPSSLDISYTYPVIRKPFFGPDINEVIDASGSGVGGWINDNEAQFAYRYVFISGSTSLLSEHSQGVAVWPNYNGGLRRTAVTVSVPFAEKLPEDLLQVDFLVRVGKDDAWKVFESVSFEGMGVSSLDDHNNGLVRVGVNFSDIFKSFAIGTSRSLGFAEALPVGCQAMTAFKNVVWLGNCLVSNDFPSTDVSLSVSMQTYGTSPDPVSVAAYKTFERGGSFNFGIEYFDLLGRSSGGIAPPAAQGIPVPDYEPSDNYSITEGIANPSQDVLNYPHLASWDLSGTDPLNIPTWARYFRIIRTENMAYSNYIDSYYSNTLSIPQLRYRTKGDDGVVEYTNVYNTLGSSAVATATTDAIALSVSALNSRGKGYSFTEGDQCLIWDQTNDVSATLRVLGVSDGWIFLQAKDLGDLDSVFLFGRFKITTPVVFLEEVPYYGASALFSIDNPGTAQRAFSRLSGVVYGDSYKDFTERAPTDIMGIDNITYTYNHPNIDSEDNRIWKKNLGHPTFLINRSLATNVPNVFAWSGQIVDGTNIDDLGSWSISDRAYVDLDGGPIQALVPTVRTDSGGSVLLVISERETFSVYLGESQLSAAAQDSIVAVSSELVNNIRTLKGGYGTTNYESVCSGEGMVFFWDDAKKRVVRYNLNGLTPISDAKMTNSFQSFSPGSNGMIHSFYNLRDSRLTIFGLPLLEGHAGGDLGLVYDSKLDGWGPCISVPSDLMGSIGDSSFSFHQGSLYINSETSSTINGVTKAPLLVFVLNELPGTPKVANIVSLDGIAPVRIDIDGVSSERTYTTYMVSSEGRTKAGIVSFPVQRDLGTFNLTWTPLEKRKLGDKLKGIYFLIKISWSGVGEFCTFIDLGFTPLPGNSQTVQS